MSHAVPFESRVAVSTHVCWPVEHEVVPAWQAVGFVPHALPAMHALQPPVPLQTAPVPHDVPAVFGVAVSMHCCVPDAHEVTPS